MKRTKFLLFIILISIVLFFSSCELAYNKKYNTTGKIWFVGIGCDFSEGGYTTQYNGNKGVGKINHAREDIDDLCMTFEYLANEKTKVPFDYICFLGDGAAYSRYHDNYRSWSNFKAEVKAKIDPSDNDIIIFAFSTHGAGNEAERLSYDDTTSFTDYGLVFYPETKGNKDCKVVMFEEIYEFIDSFKGSKFILADTCHSGGFVVPDGVTINKDSYTGAPIKYLFNNEIRSSSTVWTLAACTYYQLSSDRSDLQHGGFSYYVLKALGWEPGSPKDYFGTPKAKDGNLVTAGSIAKYVMKNGGKYKDGGNLQTPVFSAGSSDLVLFKL